MNVRRWGLLSVLVLAGCSEAGSSARTTDLSATACKMGPLDQSNLPSCCPGVCFQDGCCDPACYGPLVGSTCAPGMMCDYDVPGLQGTYTCSASGRLPVCYRDCVDLGRVD
jgi:hypothetical protein